MPDPKPKLGSSRYYYPELDGLRAIAVTIVLLFHAFPRLLPSGFLGVDVFFVISGFLITGIIFESAAAGKFSLWDFYFRRVRRIFPALSAVLLLTVVFGWFVLSANEYKTLGKHVFSSAFYFQNVNLLRESGYFDASSESKPLLHLWSLSIEEQFYLFWPIILVTSVRKNWNSLLIAAMLCTLSFALDLAGLSHHPASVFYQLHTRLWELMIGALLALHRVKYPSQWTRRSQTLMNGISCVAILSFGASLLYFDARKPFPSWTALLPLFASCAVLFVGARSFLGSWLSSRGLVYIGLISYPLYLWHWPVLSFLHILSPQYEFNPVLFYVSRGVALIASVVLAVLTYELLEKRLRSFSGESQRGIAVFWILVLSVVGLGTAGKWIESHAGLPERAVAREFKPVPVGHEAELSNCSFRLPGVEWCKTTGNEARIDLAIIGDSHALALISGLSRTLRESGISAVGIGTGQTLGLLGVGTQVPGPVSFNGVRNLDKAFEWIEQRKVPRVILVSQWAGYSDANELITEWPGRSQLSAVNVFESGLKRTLNRLAGFSRVSFLFDNPVFPFDPLEACVLRPVTFPGTKELTPCALERQSVLKQQESSQAVAFRISRTDPRLELIESLDALCREDLCPAKIGDQFLYSDSNHLTQLGVQLLAPAILSRAPHSKDGRF